MSESFAVGDRVTWTSEAGGKAKTKTGTVVAVVPPGRNVRDFTRAYWRTHKGAEGYSATPRRHESYLVSVPSKSGRGKPTLYWPRTKGLERA